MIAFCIVLLIASVQTHKVVESTEDIEPPETNITYLYPIHLNITSIKTASKVKEEKNILKEKVPDKVTNRESIVEVITTPINELNNETNDRSSKEIIKPHVEIKSRPLDKTTWKIESGFAPSDLAVKDDKVESKNVSEEFRPSQLLDYIIEEEVTPRNIYDDISPTVTRPGGLFFSSPKDEYHPNINKRPKEIFHDYKPLPYNFESYTKPKASWSPDILDSRPTQEIPVKVPAGGLYQLPDAFNAYPLLSTSHEDLGYQINEDIKEHLSKKRVNPWKTLLRLVTAIIPAGLLISALTPSLITVSPGPGNYYPSKFRRSDTNVADVEPISERCRRRLLCELHSENNYTQYDSNPTRRPRHCYKVHCEDTQALFKMLRWLLSYHKTIDNRGRDFT